MAAQAAEGAIALRCRAGAWRRSPTCMPRCWPPGRIGLRWTTCRLQCADMRARPTSTEFRFSGSDGGAARPVRPDALDDGLPPPAARPADDGHGPCASVPDQPVPVPGPRPAGIPPGSPVLAPARPSPRRPRLARPRVAVKRNSRATSAGGVVYRQTPGGLEIVLAHRRRPPLWALPKGTPSQRRDLGGDGPPRDGRGDRPRRRDRGRRSVPSATSSSAGRRATSRPCTST